LLAYSETGGLYKLIRPCYTSMVFMLDYSAVF